MKQDPNSLSPEGPASQPTAVLNGSDVGVQLSFRLWTSHGREALNWRTESAVIYLLSDLISSLGGIIESPQSLDAQFTSASDGVSAAKYLQRALLAFDSAV